ncbi:hypothetical protein AB1N83_006414 [Pleurotus pulmonarius]
MTMASLQLSLAPSPWGCRKGLPTSKMQRYDPEDETKEYSIRDLTVHVSHEDTTVYRGLLTLPDSVEPLRLVVKTDFFAETLRPKDFEHEGDMDIHLWNRNQLKSTMSYPRVRRVAVGSAHSATGLPIVMNYWLRTVRIRDRGRFNHGSKEGPQLPSNFPLGSFHSSNIPKSAAHSPTTQILRITSRHGETVSGSVCNVGP